MIRLFELMKIFFERFREVSNHQAGEKRNHYNPPPLVLESLCMRLDEGLCGFHGSAVVLQWVYDRFVCGFNHLVFFHIQQKRQFGSQGCCFVSCLLFLIWQALGFLTVMILYGFMSFFPSSNCPFFLGKRLPPNRHALSASSQTGGWWLSHQLPKEKILGGSLPQDMLAQTPPHVRWSYLTLGRAEKEGEGEDRIPRCGGVLAFVRKWESLKDLAPKHTDFLRKGQWRHFGVSSFASVWMQWSHHENTEILTSWRFPKILSYVWFYLRNCGNSAVDWGRLLQFHFCRELAEGFHSYLNTEAFFASLPVPQFAIKPTDSCQSTSWATFS